MAGAHRLAQKRSRELKLIEGVDRAAGEWARNSQLEAWLDHRAERLEAAELLASQRIFANALAAMGSPIWLPAGRAKRPSARTRRRRSPASRRGSPKSQPPKRRSLSSRRAPRACSAPPVGIGAFTALVAVVGAIAIWQYVDNRQQKAALDQEQVNLLAEVADAQLLNGHFDSALRLAIEDARLPRDGEARSLFAGVLGARSGVLPVELAANSKRAYRWRLERGLQFRRQPHRNRLLRQDRARLGRGHRQDVGPPSWSHGLGDVGRIRPDGQRIVTASRDGTACIWDAVGGQQLVVLKGHKDVVVSAAFSPDGTRIVTASYDKTARIWDAASGKQLLKLEGHKGGVWKAAFSPDGTQIVTASQDNSARIWNATTGAQVVVLSETAEHQGHEGGVWDAQFSPDGKRIVTASEDTKAIIWNAATGEPIGEPLKGHEDVVLTAAFNFDGSLIVTASQDGTAQLWDAGTGEKFTTLSGHEGGVLSAAFSPDGAHIVTASFDKTARIWDTASGNKKLVLPGQRHCGTRPLVRTEAKLSRRPRTRPRKSGTSRRVTRRCPSL